jgi:SAM-dependent methyltransferase
MSSFRSIQESLRHSYLVDILTPYLEGYHSVLDLGAASGLLANRLVDSIPGLSLVGVDVLVGSQPCVPMVVGNGKRLPFAGDAFDCVMMVDVLHHDENPQELLAEAKRVSRGSVLVKDHYWQNRLDLVLLRWADYIGNRLYGIRLPYAFLNLASWRNLIVCTGMRVVRSARFRFGALAPCKNIVFELRGQ